jgi:hypothetical protein
LQLSNLSNQLIFGVCMSATPALIAFPVFVITTTTTIAHGCSLFFCFLVLCRISNHDLSVIRARFIHARSAPGESAQALASFMQS